MNRYLKISAALAAFALLLVVMGLSTQSHGGCAGEGGCRQHFGGSRFTSALTGGPTSSCDAIGDNNTGHERHRCRRQRIQVDFGISAPMQTGFKT